MGVLAFLKPKTVIVAISGAGLLLLGLLALFTVPFVIQDVVYSVSHSTVT